MRELKFRVWDKKEKRFGYINIHPTSIMWPTPDWTNQGLLRDNDDAIGGVSFDNIEVIEQFTGLKDKNGVDIYEGDILLRHNKSELTKKEYWFPKYKVKYVGSGFETIYIGGGLNSDSAHFWFSHNPSGHYEVIGNIHEEEK